MSRVVVSVGTDHHPFPRLVTWVAEARSTLGLDVLLQRGATQDDGGMPSVEYLSPDELEAAMAGADFVVCHGGPGTIAAARRSGHRPIVVARDPGLGEHVDDHQMRYTAALAAEGAIDIASSSTELARLLGRPPERPGGAAHDAEIAAAVERFSDEVDRLLDGTLPRRRWRDRVLIRRTR